MSERRPSARPRDAASASPPALEQGALLLGDRRIPLFSGALHYFRHNPGRWRAALEALVDLGLTMVESYVPWGVHELAEDRFDFGQHDRSRDLAAFLEIAADVGLWVFLRPGPNVNAELPYFGLPRRIVLDSRNQALSPRGRPVPLIAPPRMFAVPSYASRHFRAEAARWLRVFAEVVAPFAYPNGPVVLLQIDNEAALYFRDGPFDQDYHPDALSDYAAYLSETYREIEQLNRAYGTSFASFEEVEAPRRMEATDAADLPPYLDWARFQERLLVDALGELGDELSRTGLSGLPVSHNLSMGEGGLAVTASALGRRVDLVGYDFYHSRAGLAAARRRAQRLSGASELPFAPELGVGAPPWFPPRSDDDALVSALCALAFGVRGFNLYMAVDRDRWYGAPIDGDGVPRRSAARWRRLLSALDRVGFHRLKRRTEVAVSLPREYALLARATHSLGALSPTLLDLSGVGPAAACLKHRFGFQEPIQIACFALLSRFAEALRNSGVPFVFVESDRDLGELADLKLVIAPSYEFADPARFERLQGFARGGGHVVWGPRLPERDLRMQPARFTPPGERSAVAVRSQAEADGLVRALASELKLERRWAITPYPVDLAVHEDAEGPRVLFVMHPGAEPVEAELDLPDPCSLTDALSGESFSGDGIVTIPMPGRTCRMLLYEPPAPMGPRKAAKPRPPAARAGRSS